MLSDVIEIKTNTDHFRNKPPRYCAGNPFWVNWTHYSGLALVYKMSEMVGINRNRRG